MGKGFVIGSFIVGGVIGAAVGLLYAPRPGSESRAIVADKVDEVWGKGQDLYVAGIGRVQDGIASVQPALEKKNDELREKIELARERIAIQVAKNAAAAQEAINEKVPVVAEKITQAADAVAEMFRDRAAAAASETEEAIAPGTVAPPAIQ